MMLKLHLMASRKSAAVWGVIGGEKVRVGDGRLARIIPLS
jgi:hypothetical protein